MQEPDDDSLRVGVTAKRRRNGDAVQQQRTSAGRRLVLVLFLITTAGCGFRKDPQKIYDQAWLTLKQGDLGGAMTVTENALNRYPSENSEWHWKFTGIKAQVLEMQGQDNEALRLLTPEPPPSLQDSEFAIRRKLTQALAAAYSQHNNEASQYISDGENLAKAHHPELLGEVALRKGTVCFFAGDMKGAEAAYRAALESARKRKDPYFEAAALSGLGVVDTRLGHYDEAIEWDRTALQVAQAVGARYSQAQIFGNTAWCYRKLGDFESALALYNQAEAASRQNGMIGDQIYWLAGISNVYHEQGQYLQAEAVLSEALDLARGRDDKGILVEYLTDLAEIAAETGRTELAEKYYRETTSIVPNNPDETAGAELALVGAAIQEAKHDYPAAEKSYREIAARPLVDSSQRWEAQARLARIYVEEGLTAKAEAEFRHSLATLEQVRASVKAEELRVSFLSTAVSLYNEYIDFLMTRGRALDALQVAELSRARTLAEGLGRRESMSTPPGNSRAQQLAGEMHSILLFYWIGPEHSYLWVISPAKLVCLPIARRVEIEPVLQKYRKAIVNGEDVLAGSHDGEKLYEMLVAPAQALIPENSRVVVLPAESLYGLNFETLIVSGPKPHFWIEDVTLSTAGSLTLLSGMSRKGSGGARSLLLVGNAESPNKDFPPLPQGAVEMRKVSAHFRPEQQKVLEGSEATASAYLRSNPQKFAYLHFVTHGTASLTRPLESAVILSREGESYKLYARDIVTQRLDAQLVTISACNGAGTRAYAGEGLVGLSWAFLRAGAHQVIASLWEVSDASSTGQLMDKLYEGLDRAEDPAVALRNAKLFILRANSGTVFRKPFYWAPFQLYAGS